MLVAHVGDVDASRGPRSRRRCTGGRRTPGSSESTSTTSRLRLDELAREVRADEAEAAGDQHPLARVGRSRHARPSSSASTTRARDSIARTSSASSGPRPGARALRCTTTSAPSARAAATVAYCSQSSRVPGSGASPASSRCVDAATCSRNSCAAAQQRAHGLAAPQRAGGPEQRRSAARQDADVALATVHGAVEQVAAQVGRVRRPEARRRPLAEDDRLELGRGVRQPREHGGRSSDEARRAGDAAPRSPARPSCRTSARARGRGRGAAGSGPARRARARARGCPASPPGGTSAGNAVRIPGVTSPSSPSQWYETPHLRLALLAPRPGGRAEVRDADVDRALLGGPERRRLLEQRDPRAVVLVPELAARPERVDPLVGGSRGSAAPAARPAAPPRARPGRARRPRPAAPPCAARAGARAGAARGSSARRRRACPAAAPRTSAPSPRAARAGSAARPRGRAATGRSGAARSPRSAGASRTGSAAASGR